jgi:hypothetical protein
MSHRALAWVVPIQVLPSQKSVLWALANCANDDGLCWPSNAWLRLATCLSERTVQGAIQALVAAGLIEIVWGGGRGRTTRYRLLLGPVGVVAETPQDLRGCAEPETPQPLRGKSKTPRQVRGKSGETPHILLPLPGKTPQPLPPEPESTSKGVSPGEGKPAAPRAERGTRLPADWWPDEAQRSFAADLGLEVDWVAGQFRDHWHAKAGAAARMVNWDATWRGWCRRQVEFDARRRPVQPRKAPRLSGWERSIYDEDPAAEGARGPIIDMAAEG